MINRVVELWNSDGSPALRTSNRESDPVKLVVQDVVGWYGGSGTRAEDFTRGMGHGSYQSTAKRTSRAMTVKGLAVFPDQQTRERFERHLSGVLGDGEFGRIRVTTGDLTLNSRVRLDGEPKISHNGTEAADFEIPIWSGDPWLYSDDRSATVTMPGVGVGFRWGTGAFQEGHLRWGEGTAQDAMLTNQGNAAAWPVFRVEGNFPEGFVLELDGHRITYPGSVVRTDPVWVYTGSGQIKTRTGPDLTYLLSDRQWWPIRPGGTVRARLRARDTMSEGWATATWQDTYL